MIKIKVSLKGSSSSFFNNYLIEMSNRAKFRDSTPFLTHSGKTTTIDGDNVDRCLRQELYFTVRIKFIQPQTSTPERIKKYRKSTREVPGVKQLHPGVYSDPKDHENMVHGVKSTASEHVENCVKDNSYNGVNGFLKAYNERNYVRTTKYI